jgi:CHAT domain-containing protein
VKLPQPRGGLVDAADIRALVPLLEAADELCDIAHNLRIPVGDIHIGSRATELQIKRSSESGDLAAYRILHFATHGALSASEIAGFKINPDWVILSTCNIAASGTDSGEALSGMARAFFYAGARALPVSHWAVNSESTVKLIKATLNKMSSDRSLGRAEALRRSMLGLIEKGEVYEAHSAYWGARSIARDSNCHDAIVSRLRLS